MLPGVTLRKVVAPPEPRPVILLQKKNQRKRSSIIYQKLRRQEEQAEGEVAVTLAPLRIRAEGVTGLVQVQVQVWEQKGNRARRRM
mmetsp:Transcript_20137/g.40425  ORF Transcript_20137/g.40425 Transcript_20137/m.40425 type:complete len:86 (-) Transcript_20137:57-314(-)